LIDGGPRGSAAGPTRVTPDVAEVLAQAWEQQRARNLDAAARLCEQALTADPENADGHHLLGVLACQAGHADVALHHLGRALARQPQDAALHGLTGMVFRTLGRPGEARASLEAALRLDPNSAVAHNDLGIVLAEQGALAQAVPHFETAARLDPGLAQAHYNRARALGGLERLDDAIAANRQALRLDPGYVNARNNIAIELGRLGRYDEAFAQLDEALRLDPADPAAHCNRAVLLLRCGRFAEGFAEYEWRWRTRPPKSPPRDFPQPPWNGEDIRDATIMLHAEQGFGDTLQFCRYAPLVARRCGKVYLEVPRALLRLLRQSLGAENLEVIPRLADFPATHALPRTDYHCPLLSLPRVLGTSLVDVPADIPYLAADAAQAAAWSQRLADLPGRKVGLVWAGLPQYADDAHRSLPLERLAPLGGVAGVTFISLQTGAPAGQAAVPPPGLTLHDASAGLRDFADTAALVAALDLVISVDTAAAHLAGALGTKVWLLNRFDTDWRWLIDRAASPWYPTVRIFRQPRRGDWDSVLAHVCAELARFA
jgi:tetratricopeptide (TPR) repeat protein